MGSPRRALGDAALCAERQRLLSADPGRGDVAETAYTAAGGVNATSGLRGPTGSGSEVSAVLPAGCHQGLQPAAGGGGVLRPLAHLGTSASLEPGQLSDKDSQVFPTSNTQDAVSLDPSWDPRVGASGKATL